MKIYLATDHAGFELKEKIKQFLSVASYDVIDCGATELNKDDDYPDFVVKAATAVSRDPEGSRAIVLGGSGQGEAMVSNRQANVRAAVYYGGSLDIVKLSRQHNDVNVLALGARFVTEREALTAVETWLTTPFSAEERHIRRIKKF